MIVFENRDCMEAMREFPDGFFDLAICDPPYGDGNGGDGRERFGGRFEASIKKGKTKIRVKDFEKLGGKYQEAARVERRGGTWAAKYGDHIVKWDIAPKPEYFKELFRISKNCIIWGGNYFELPPTRCFICWRKINIPAKGFTMAPIEYAWTSFKNRNAIYIELNSQVFGDPLQARFHPTQKPVALYKELLAQFAKPGYKILDTHAGSASSLVACYDMGFDAWGYEIDAEYYRQAKERLEAVQAQVRMDI